MTVLSNRQQRLARLRRLLERIGFDMTAERLSQLPPSQWAKVRPPSPRSGESR